MSGPPIAQDANRLVVFGSQLIGVVIVIVGLLTQQGELRSVRPPGRPNIPAPTKTDAKTDTFARLWDDPLQDKLPVRPADEAIAQNPSPTPEHARYIFLWNILEGAPWPDAKERRLRIRYAIVSAILAEGYRPLRASLLHSLQTRPGRFETFCRQDQKKKLECVCVIWTPKQSNKFPIDQQELRTEICNQDKLIAEGGVPFRFLHHGTSQDLYNYLTAPPAAPEASPQQSISFMRATIPLADLNSGTFSPPPNRPYVQEVTTDDKLVESLFRELCLRIPALNDKSKTPPPRVVVFTESDTIYSQAIVDELEKRLTLRTNAKCDVYSYLQALDGSPEEARAPASPGDSKPPDIATSLLQGRAISETSFGTSQFDYLRRTALDLKARRNQPGEDVVAVGVLGSDIYDKMLVLQAVRPALPAAVFFTTDLDALYLEREMQPFTRNLVVASADDLGAKESGEPGARWKLPPMRDSYQTVLVKEVRNILGSQQAKKEAPIFEIAAGKSIELDKPGEEGSYLLWLLAQWWSAIIVFLLALSNGFLILWAISTRQPERDAQMVPAARKLVGLEITLACVGILFLLYKLWLSEAPSLFGEPLALGISIWPSVMIRLLAFLVAIVLLCRASYSFVVDGIPQKDKLKKALAGHVEFRSRDGLWGLWGKSVQQIFDHFANELFDRKARRCRVIKVSLVYLAFSFVLFAIWPPTVPARGAVPLLIEKTVLSLGVALYIIHLIFCLDLHVSAFSLLRNLRHHYHSAAEQPIKNSIDETGMLTALSTLTSIIGKTLLYPLTVLTLIILSRLSIFDNWVMTASLTITFALGALVLVGASLILWSEGFGLQKAVLAQTSVESAKQKTLEAVNTGVFAAWYSQPIFSAIFSTVAVFGSVTIAGPLTRLFFSSF